MAQVQVRPGSIPAPAGTGLMVAPWVAALTVAQPTAAVGKCGLLNNTCPVNHCGRGNPQKNLAQVPALPLRVVGLRIDSGVIAAQLFDFGDRGATQ